MFTILFKLIFKLFNALLSLIFSLIPGVGFLSGFLVIYSKFLQIICFGWRFLYFTFGDMLYIYSDALILFISAKFVVLPIVSVLRSVIAHGGGN